MARAATTKNAKESKKKPKKKATQKSEIAVILSGGKQYVVSVGDIVDVELLSREPNKEYKEGETVEFDKVLLVDNGTDATIGTPYIAGAKVKAIYQGEKKGKKLSIVRFKAKSNRDRKIGHRQKYARVKIEALV